MAAKKKATKRPATPDTAPEQVEATSAPGAETFDADQGPVHPTPDELARSTQHEDEEEISDPDFEVKPEDEGRGVTSEAHKAELENAQAVEQGGEDPAADAFESVAAQAADAEKGPTREKLIAVIDRAAVKAIKEADTAVGFGRIVDAVKAANGGTGVSRQLLKDRLQALTADGKIQRATVGQFHFVTT